LASKTSFAIIGYDLNDEPHELMNMMVDEEEQIILITFLNDDNTSNILLVTYDYHRECTVSRILSIRQEIKRKFED